MAYHQHIESICGHDTENVCASCLSRYQRALDIYRCHNHHERFCEPSISPIFYHVYGANATGEIPGYRTTLLLSYERLSFLSRAHYTLLPRSFTAKYTPLEFELLVQLFVAKKLCKNQKLATCELVSQCIQYVPPAIALPWTLAYAIRSIGRVKFEGVLYIPKMITGWLHLPPIINACREKRDLVDYLTLLYHAAKGFEGYPGTFSITSSSTGTMMLLHPYHADNLGRRYVHSSGTDEQNSFAECYPPFVGVWAEAPPPCADENIWEEDNECTSPMVPDHLGALFQLWYDEDWDYLPVPFNQWDNWNQLSSDTD